MENMCLDHMIHITAGTLLLGEEFSPRTGGELCLAYPLLPEPNSLKTVKLSCTDFPAPQLVLRWQKALR
jgi:hypothetical protein